MSRIEIDRTLCSALGSCLDAAPELIELGVDGIAAARVDLARDDRRQVSRGVRGVR